MRSKYGQTVLIKMEKPGRKLGMNVVQFGVDYFPRTRGVSTLSSPSVIVKILKEAWALRSHLNALAPKGK
jgi:hypothetical protein